MSSRYYKYRRLLLTYTVAIIVCFVILFPLYWMITTSLQNEKELFKSRPNFFPPKIEWDSYAQIFTEHNMLGWLKNSLIVAICSTALSVPVSLFAAYSISRLKFRGSQFTMFLMLLTQMLPVTLIVLPLFVIFKDLKLLDTHKGLVLANFTFSLPLSISILKGFLDTIPKEIEEAAAIDGCSKWLMIPKVIVPISLPGLVSSSVIAFFASWNEYLFASTFINNEAKWLGTVGLASFQGVFLTPWNKVLAASTVYTLPALIFYLFVQKYIVSGLTAGSVKG